MVVDGKPALVDRLRRREPAAFEEVYEAYRHRVFSFLARLSRNNDAAAELADEVWLRLVTNADRLRADTVVVGTCRHPRRHWFGSTAVRLLHTRRWPVVVVP